MKLALKINDERFQVDKFRIIPDYSIMPHNKKGFPTGEMYIRCEIRAVGEGRTILIRESCLKELPREQYEAMKIIINLAQAFGFKARRVENVPMLSLDKRDKYGIGSISVTAENGMRGIFRLTGEVKAGWPLEREDIKWTGYMVEEARVLKPNDLDAPRQKDLAHVLTEILAMFDFKAETGLEICSNAQENTDTSTPKAQ